MTTETREVRAQAIRDAAVVRQHLGQAAIHRRLPNGAHEVILRGGAVFVGTTLYETIEKARGSR